MPRPLVGRELGLWVARCRVDRSQVTERGIHL